MVVRSTVSVLLPVFNAARHLQDCLTSLSRQSLASFEIIAVDDGSTDRSPEILRAWSEREPRLRVVPQTHKGLVATLNHGLALCTGGLVARMDSDDLAHPRRLELQQEALDEHPEIGVLGCRVEHFGDGGVGEGFRVYERWLNGLLDDESIRRELFVESPLPHPSVMVRRSHLDEAGGYQDAGWPEDYDL